MCGFIALCLSLKCQGFFFDSFRDRNKIPACRSELPATRQTVKKFGPKITLERLDPSCNGGMLFTQTSRGARQAIFFCKNKEVAQIVPIHMRYLTPWN